MIKKLIVAIVAAASIGTAMIGTADARDRNRANVIIEFGGFGGGGGYYRNRSDRDYGYRSRYDDDYNYGRRNRGYNRYVYDDFAPYCGTRRIKVKKWNRAHTRYTVVSRRVRSC